MPGTPSGRERITLLLSYALVLLLAYLVYAVMRPFFVPLAWAAVLVIFFYPLQADLQVRYGRTRAAALSTLVMTVLLIVPALLVMSAFLSEASGAFEVVRNAVASYEGSWTAGLFDYVERFIPEALIVDVPALITKAAEEAGAWLASRLGAFVQITAIFLFNLIVAIFAAFFLFRDADRVMRAVRDLLPIDLHLRERLIRQTGEVVTAAVVSSFIVASVQGFLGGVAFWVLDITAPVFWGVVMALFCLIPLGAWVVWLPAALWLVATGHVARGVILAGVGLGLISLVDNFLRPMLLSGRTRLNGLLMFIGLLGGVAAFGVLGLMLGPVVIATAVGLIEAYAAEAESADLVLPSKPLEG
jgi:predicted PurR-regulated permease PerM